MKTKIAAPTQLDIIGDRGRLSTREALTSVIKQCRQKLGYLSVFAAVPAMVGSQVSEVRANDTKKPDANVAGREVRRFAGLNRSLKSTGLLKRQSAFRLPHQKGNFSLAATLAGNDNCPGRSIPGGTYTAAAPYVDSGDTTGANNTVSRAYYLYYVYYNWDAFGPDHVYTFMITSRGPNPEIEVSTTSGTYKPLIYALHGSIGGCPSGTDNHPMNELLLIDSRWAGGTNSVKFNSSAMSFLPLNVPLHLFVDSRQNDANGSGPYTLRMQDVTIANSCANPIDCPEYFIQQHYFDFLGRAPDPPGFAGWLALLNNCASGDPNCDRIQVSSAFFRSPEFQTRGYFIYRFYSVAFGRKPDYQEFSSDLLRVSGFFSDSGLEQAKRNFSEEFVLRPAFGAKFNGLTPTQYVDTLLSGAGITHPARDFWIAALLNGSRTRGQVLREIAESSEVYNKYYNQAFVVMQYFGYLRRQPDALYLNWLAELEATGDYRNMTNGFINSIEYRSRFTP